MGIKRHIKWLKIVGYNIEQSEKPTVFYPFDACMGNHPSINNFFKPFHVP